MPPSSNPPREKPENALLKRVEAALPELSRSERRVAGFLLKRPQDLVATSVKELALMLSVSEPTIIRFCRTIGCDGYRDLKIRLTQDLAVRQALMDAAPKPKDPRPGAHGVPAQDSAGAVYNKAVEALSNIEAVLDRDQLLTAARLIVQARRVTMYGIGGSSALLALEMHNRLFRLNIACVAYTDSYLQRVSAATLGAGDTVFFVSSTGRPRSLIDSAELARHYGASSVGITPRGSPLGRELDLCLDLELSQAGVSQFQPNPMRYAQLYLIDSLAFAVAEMMGEPAAQALDRGRASVAALHGIAPQQPIGD